MNINDIPEVFLWFIIYSFGGWLFETVMTSVTERRLINRGFLNGPYCPIYGVGALLFIYGTNHIPNPLLRFVVGGIVACTLEYVTSWTLEKLFNARWWDYTTRHLSINGRVCLEGFLVFGLGAAITPVVHQHVSNFTGQFSATTINSAFSIILIIFIADIIVTNQALNKFNKILRDYQGIINKHRSNILEFIRRGKRAFEMRIGSNGKVRNILGFQQRRILSAFPHFNSTIYKEALARIRELYSNPNKNSANTQTPNRQKTTKSARKKARKRATATARKKRRK